MEFDKAFLDKLFEQAVKNPRLRQNFDLRTSSSDTSQRMLNALMPETKVPIHRHPMSTENVILLCGNLVEILYDEEGYETERISLDASVGNFGCVIPAGVWHTVEVHEPSVIYEAKDGRYGEDGSETYENFKVRQVQSDTCLEIPNNPAFPNSLDDLKNNINHLIGMERKSGSMDVITPLYVSRMLNVSLEEVEACMKEMGII